MNHAWKLIVLVAVVLAALFWYRHATAPDVQLAKRLAPVCDIFRDHVRTPEKGVDALFSFLGHNTPDLLRDFGRVLVEIEGIEDDARHDARAKQAAQRIREPLEACAADAERFGQAVSEDEAATRKLEHGSERFGRTLSILFSSVGREGMLPPYSLLHALIGGR